MTTVRCGIAVTWALVTTVASLWPSQSAADEPPLVPGDMAMIRVNSSTDGFTVLALRPLSAGQALYWTDNGWTTNNTFLSSEGAGTVDVLTADVSPGRTFEVSAPGLAVGGDQAFLFTGTLATPQLIYGVCWGGVDWYTGTFTAYSADPADTGSGLDDIHTLSLPGVTASWKYNGPIEGSPEELLAMIANPAYWVPTTATQWTGGDFLLITTSTTSSSTSTDTSTTSTTTTEGVSTSSTTTTSTTTADGLFVDLRALGQNDGSSWANAYTNLATAFGALPPGRELWIAGGLYKPDSVSGGSFRLLANRGVYGGFAGTESTRAERLNPTLNPTILSGDLNGDYSNTYGIDATKLIGIAGSNVVVDGIVFEFVTADDAFGTVNSENGPGAIRINSMGPITIRGCEFRYCLGDYGIGVVAYGNYGSTLLIENSVFRHNRRYNNSSPALYLRGGHAATLRHCTISRNDPCGDGSVQARAGTVTLENTILVETNLTYDPAAFYYASGFKLNGATLVGTWHCVLVNDWTYPFPDNNTGNVYLAPTSLPGFINADSGEFRLAADSPAVNAGLNARSSPQDRRGVARPWDETVDIGAYEGPTFHLSTAVSGLGGGVVLPPDGTRADPGEIVVLSAIPDAISSFSEWSGDLAGTNNPATLLMNDEKQVQAIFARLPAELTTSSTSSTTTDSTSSSTSTSSTTTSTSSSTTTATPLVMPDDVAIIRVNGISDGFTLLALRELRDPQVLFWTDKGWQADNQFRGGEGAGVTDILSRGIVPAGGTLEVTASGLGNTGDQLFLFRGTSANPSLAYGVDWGNSPGWDADATLDTTSADPATTGGGLLDHHTVSLGANGAWQYNGPQEGSIGELLGAIANSNHWIISTAAAWTNGTFDVAATSTSTSTTSSTSTSSTTSTTSSSSTSSTTSTSTSSTTSSSTSTTTSSTSTSTSSSTTSSTTAPDYNGPLLAPANPAASNTIPNGIRITWIDTNDNESGYRIERRASTNATWALNATLGPNTAAHLDLGVAAGELYFYRLFAHNLDGFSPPSAIVSALTPSAPVAPDHLTASAVGAGAIVLVWRDRATDELQFELERRAGQAGPWQHHANLAANSTAFLDDALEPNVLYGYRLRAINAVGASAFTAEAVAGTPPTDSDCGYVLQISGHAITLDGFSADLPATGTVATVVGGSLDIHQSSPRGVASIQRVVLGFRNASGFAAGHPVELLLLYGIPGCPARELTGVPIPPDLRAPDTAGVYTLWVEAFIGLDDPLPAFLNATRLVETATAARLGTLTVAPRPAGLADVTAAHREGIVGTTLQMPVLVNSSGGESALSFSLLFDADVLALQGIGAGPDAPTAWVSSNTNQAQTGRVGVVLSLPVGQSFGEGVKHVLSVTFHAVATGQSPVAFTDEPVARELVHGTPGTLINTTWHDAVLTTGDPGFEGDVAPRPRGDSQITSADIALMNLLVLGQEGIADSNEFRKADCTDLASRGDGQIRLSDLYQVMRWEGQTPLVPVGGPWATLDAEPGTSNARAGWADTDRVLSLSALTVPRGATFWLPLQLAAQGDEAALAMTLAYDPGALSFLDMRATGPATNAAGLSALVEQEQGRVGLIITMPTNAVMPAGNLTLFEFAFQAGAGSAATTTAVTFANSPTLCSVADATAAVLDCTYVDALLTLDVPAVAGAPTAPAGLTAVSVATNQINLTWNDTADNESGIRVRRRPGVGAWTLLATLPADSSDYADTGLGSGLAYTYQVEAYNVSGAGASDPVTASTWTPVDQWRLTHFGDPAPVGLAADHEDWDADGIANLMEYALGLDPTAADGHDALFRIEVQDGVMVGNERFSTASYERPVDSALNLQIDMELSTNITSGWPSLMLPVDETATGDVIRVRMRSDTPYRQRDAEFYRMRIDPKP